MIKDRENEFVTHTEVKTMLDDWTVRFEKKLFSKLDTSIASITMGVHDAMLPMSDIIKT